MKSLFLLAVSCAALFAEATAVTIPSKDTYCELQIVRWFHRKENFEAVSITLSSASNSKILEASKAENQTEVSQKVTGWTEEVVRDFHKKLTGSDAPEGKITYLLLLEDLRLLDLEVIDVNEVEHLEGDGLERSVSSVKEILLKRI